MLHEWFVYDQDVCLGTVRGQNEEEAWQCAKRKFGFTTDACPVYLEMQ